MKNQVVKQYPILKSPDVEKDMGHDHKLWWIDIEKDAQGVYQVVSYAQLFRVNLKDRFIEGDHTRRYELGKHDKMETAEQEAETRINKKKTAFKQYEFFKSRSTLEDISESIIQEFLSKYGKLSHVQ